MDVFFKKTHIKSAYRDVMASLETLQGSIAISEGIFSNLE